jgi:hypothetical protein
MPHRSIPIVPPLVCGLAMIACREAEPPPQAADPPAAKAAPTALDELAGALTERPTQGALTIGGLRVFPADELLRPTLDGRISAWRRCAVEALAKDPTTCGYLLLEGALERDGFRKRAAITLDTIADGELGACLTEAATRWHGGAPAAPHSVQALLIVAPPGDRAPCSPDPSHEALEVFACEGARGTWCWKAGARSP